jgi:hypothetical protein
MKRLILLLGITALLSGCFSQEKPSSTTSIHDIVAIWYHEGSSYSFTTVENNKLKNYGFGNDTLCTTEVVLDLKPNEKPWATVTTHHLTFGETRNSYIIHAHSISDIQGAGWNHGKFGSGQTTRLE